MFTPDELRYVVHRAGAVESVHGDEITEMVWLQLAEIAFHADRFKLKHTCCLAVAKEFIGSPVVKFQGLKINGYAL